MNRDPNGLWAEFRLAPEFPYKCVINETAWMDCEEISCKLHLTAKLKEWQEIRYQQRTRERAYIRARGSCMQAAKTRQAVKRHALIEVSDSEEEPPAQHMKRREKPVLFKPRVRINITTLEPKNKESRL